MSEQNECNCGETWDFLWNLAEKNVCSDCMKKVSLGSNFAISDNDLRNHVRTLHMRKNLAEYRQRKLLESLKWTMEKIHEKPFEWSCEEDAKKHYETLDLIERLEKK